MLKWPPFWLPFVIFVNLNENGIKLKYMEIVSAREFRKSQGRFLTAAREGRSVMLTSRYGNFKIVPVSDSDEIVEKDIRSSYAEVLAHIKGDSDLPLAKDVVF